LPLISTPATVESTFAKDCPTFLASSSAEIMVIILPDFSFSKANFESEITTSESSFEVVLKFSCDHTQEDNRVLK